MAGIILIGLVTVGFLVLFIISYISMRTLESKVIGAKGRRPFGIATLALFFWALYAAILTVQQSLVYAESQVPVSFLATSFFSQAFLYLGNVLLLSAVYMVIHNRLQSVGANRKLIWWLHWSAVTIYAILVTAQFIIFARNQTAFMGYARGGYRSDYINDLGTSETYNSAIVTASSVILWLCIFEMILINAFVWTKSRKQNGGKRVRTSNRPLS